MNKQKIDRLILIFHNHFKGKNIIFVLTALKKENQK